VLRLGHYETLGTVMDDVNGESFCLQPTADRFSQTHFIFDD